MNISGVGSYGVNAYHSAKAQQVQARQHQQTHIQSNVAPSQQAVQAQQQHQVQQKSHSVQSAQSTQKVNHTESGKGQLIDIRA